MANKEDIERARQGKDAWNAWAERSPGVAVDFSGAGVGFDFPGFVFPGRADFSNAMFRRRDACFSNARFCGEAIFAGTIFDGDAEFAGAIFNQSAFFAGAEFRYQTNFGSAQFKGLVVFNDADFKQTTVFTKSTSISVPSFHGANLHGDTTFERIDWGSRPHEKQNAYDAARAWARLRVEMSLTHKHEDELFFFAKELNARAHDRCNEPLTKHLLYRVYLTLGAGRSAAKPLGWLLGLNALLFLPIYWYATSTIHWRKLPIGDVLANGISFNIPPDAVSFTLGQALPFIGGSNPERSDLYRRLFASTDSAGIDMPLWLEFVGAFQQLVGVGLLFMIGLALRNRFRMK